MADMNFREILSRKPFKRTLPSGYLSHGIMSSDNPVSEPEDSLAYRIVTQADFMREYDPSGHAINNPLLYPDVIKKDPESGRYYKEEVVRCAFAFQRVITTKHIIHLCGNDIQFELPDTEKDEENGKLLLEFRRGWAEKNMEIHFYEAVRSLKITGDCALVGYFKDGVFGVKSLSYLDGDTLYPHFDPLSGELVLFARRYYSYDEDGNTTIEWVEVWDNTRLYRFNRGTGAVADALHRIREIFGLQGYKLVESRPHGFNFVPVAYHRDEKGACWSNSQDSIEKYELAFSQLSQNNQAYAFPIMYLKGDDVEIVGDMDGAVKCITMGKDDDAGFLNKQDASESFATQLDKLYKMIYEQSFAVIPPELKSGDLPGVAVKLLYSPAYENAMRDAQEMNPFLDKIVRIFKYGYGFETMRFTTMMAFKVYAWIEPYYHKSTQEIVTNLATAVQNGFLSKRTASERCPDYPKNGEIDRIMREDIEKRQLNLEFRLAELEGQAEIDMEVAQTEMQTVDENGQIVHTKPSNVRTGHGRHTGRPNKSGVEWDENGNWAGRNNWNRFNRSQA